MAAELKLLIGSKLPDVRKGISEILIFLKEDVNAPGDAVVELRLIFSELLFNAATHGNHNDIHKHIWVEARFDDGCVYASVRDEGEGFDVRGIMETNKKAGINKRGNGRGLVLVAALTDRFDYEMETRRAVFEKRVIK